MMMVSSPSSLLVDFKAGRATDAVSSAYFLGSKTESRKKTKVAATPILRLMIQEVGVVR